MPFWYLIVADSYARLRAEWYQRLKASGFRDIEYGDGSLLGVSIQEVERAPDAAEFDGTREYHSMTSEWLAAASWRGRAADKRVWRLHVDGGSVREIAAATARPATTVHRALDRLRNECAAWWEETRPQRENPPPPRGRPRKEQPRREFVALRLTREERLVIDDGARRAGAVRPHHRTAWIRAVVLAAAQSVPYTPRKAW